MSGVLQPPLPSYAFADAKTPAEGDEGAESGTTSARSEIPPPPATPPAKARAESLDEAQILAGGAAAFEDLGDLTEKLGAAGSIDAVADLTDGPAVGASASIEDVEHLDEIVIEPIFDGDDLDDDCDEVATRGARVASHGDRLAPGADHRLTNERAAASSSERSTTSSNAWVRARVPRLQH